MRKLAIEELNRISVEEFKSETKIPVSVVLDNVRSLNNIGSIFRTCDAFRIEKLYLCGITACPPHKDIHKTALGATESVSWEYWESTLALIHKLKTENYFIISAEQAEGSTTLEKMELSKNRKYLIVFGHEIHGVGQEVIDISDVCAEIPQAGTKHSLNVAVSAGIILWEAFRQLK
ncbi:MAG: RNA methyltransferase [Bacteroidales bacterium]|nr:RNA methyltransferase [Bacteroidales bacterium]